MIINNSHKAQSSSPKSQFSPKTCLVIIILVLCCFIITIIFHHDDISHISSRSLSQSSKEQMDRQQYINIATQAYNKNEQHSELHLAASNFLYGKSTNPRLNDNEIKEYNRLNNIYRFDRFHSELPFCLIVQQLPWKDGFSYEFTLNSIFNQNYTNYRAIILNEPSHEGEFQKIQSYLNKHRISLKNALNILITVEKGILKNIYDYSHQYCSPASISLNIIDGSQLIGKNVLKVFNVLYQANQVGLIYSNFYRYNHKNHVKLGFNVKYRQEELINIRNLGFHISTSVTYRTDFLLDLSKEDLKDHQKKYLDNVYQQALFFPLVERMGGVVLKIDGFHMLANDQDGNYSQFLQRIRSKKNASLQIRHRKPHKRNQTYFQQSKNRLMITSFAQDYLITNPQLASISTTTKQHNQGARLSNKSPIFSIPLNYLQTRAADRYIYYSTLDIAIQKWQFQLSRFDHIALIQRQYSNQMIKYNLFLGESIDDQQQQLQVIEYQKAQERHQLSVYSSLQNPFCIVISQLPNEEYFRFQHLLNSVFAQNYSNFFVVINNRNPMLDKFVHKYLHYYKIDKDKYAYRFNQDYTSTSLEAVYKSIHQHCSQQSIAIILSGRDQLLGRNVLKIFNAQHQRKSDDIIFAPTCFYDQKTKEYGVIDPPEFTPNQVKQNRYREAEKRFNFLITFKSYLFSAIDEKDLKDGNGKYYKTNLQQAIYFPLFELSCQKNRKIAGVYNIRNRDLQVGVRYLQSTKDYIKKLPKYPCFKQKMASLYNQTDLLASISNFRVQAGGDIMPNTVKTVPDLLSTNNRGQKIENYLYANNEIILQRKKYQLERMNAAQELGLNQMLTSLNLPLSYGLNHKNDEIIKDDYENAVQSFETTSIERPICIIADQMNFTPQYQFQFLLNSIYLQNYTNYFAVIFNDGSEIGDSLLRKYLHFYKIPHENYVYNPNKQSASALENIIYAVQTYCARGSIVLYLGGSDQLIGRNVLKQINWAHYSTNFQVITFDYLTYTENKFQTIPSLDYASNYKGKGYRNVEEMPKFAAFNSELLLKLDKSNFQGEKEEYFKLAIQRALFVPLLELACSKVQRFQQANFLMKQGKNKQRKPQAELSEEKKINGKIAFDCLDKP